MIQSIKQPGGGIPASIGDGKRKRAPQSKVWHVRPAGGRRRCQKMRVGVSISKMPVDHPLRRIHGDILYEDAIKSPTQLAYFLGECKAWGIKLGGAK